MRTPKKKKIADFNDRLNLQHKIYLAVKSTWSVFLSSSFIFAIMFLSFVIFTYLHYFFACFSFYLLTWFYLSVSVSPLFGKVRGWVCPKPFPVQDEKERFLPVQSVMPIKTRNILLQRKVKKSKSIERVSIYWALRCSTSDSYVVR